jgi:peptidyl-prolyl cis-trans isomerase SurA
MKKKINNTFFLIFLFFFYLTWANSLENKIIVKVNNKIITNVDVQNEIKYLKALNPTLEDLNKDKMFQIGKVSLVKEKIKEIEISKLKLNDITEEYFQELIKSIYNNIGLENEEEFINYIKSYDIEMHIIKKKFSIEAKWNQLIYNKFYSKLKIDIQQIKNDLKLDNKFLNSYLLYEIVFNTDQNNQTNEIFEKIKKSISENGFENTAAIYSISQTSKSGGMLGWINENAISKKILREITSLKNNEYTNPILVPGGFLVLNVRDKKITKKEINIEKEVALRIRSLQNQQLNQYSNMHFKKVKKDITINEK